jgi:flagellar hook-associated protein 1 FlgK
MSLSGTLNTANAGLQVTQAALQIVGGNVANAQTPGYVRKTLDQTTIASGADISVRAGAINRQLDTLVQLQLRQATSGGAYADKLSDLYQQLQSLYGAPGAPSAVDTLFSNFTSSLQALAASPDDFSAQSGVVSSAQLLAQQLNSLSNNIQTIREAAEQGISADVQTANNLLQNIASINRRVSTANSNDPTTATLLDQRDQAIDALSKLMDIKVVQGQFNQVSVFTGSGNQLVGSDAVVLSFNAQGTLGPNSQWSSDPKKSGVGTITMTAAGGSTTDLISAGAIQSGEIAAYLQMRDQILPQAQTQLDDFAAKMSQAMSDVTTAGTPVTVGTQNGFTVDTAGLQTGNIIHLTYTDAGNVSHNISIVRVDDASALPLPDSTTADPNDKVVGVNFGNGPLSPAVVAQLNSALGSTGLQFSNSGSTLQVLNDPANTIKVNSLSETDTATSVNGGSPQLPLFIDDTVPYTGSVTSQAAQSVGYAQRITVNPLLVSNPGATVDYTAGTLSGDNSRPAFLYHQMTAALSTFSPATGIGTSGQPMTGTLTSFLGQVMTQQGQAAANASSLKEGQDVVVNSLQQRMNNNSGVNIDQEMSSLLTLQNTYSANARVFSVVQQLFQTLMQI